MRRVLIAGCGYVGAAAAELFHKAGWAVEGWTRSEPATGEMRPGYELRAIDLADERQVQSAPGRFDVVIHSASTRGGDADAYRRVYFEGTRHLLDRFAGAAFLFVSSTSVYGQRAGEWVTEESAAEPEHETGRILRGTEDLVLGREGSVARFAGIYGPGRSALLRKFLRGQAVMDTAHDRFVNQVHRDDAAAALYLLGSGPAVAAPRIYNVADDLPLPQRECYRWLAERLERSLPASGQAPAPRKRGESNKRVSNARLRTAGWFPRFPTFMEGMEKSVLPGLDQDSL